MKLIDNNITEIIAGYNAILRDENDLRSKWRPTLLAAYAKRKANLVDDNQHQEQRNIILWVIAILGSIIFLVGVGTSFRGIAQSEENLLLYCCGGPLLGLLGLLILGAGGFTRRNKTKLKSKRVPIHPLRSRVHKHGIYPDLRESWMEGLNGSLKHEVPDDEDDQNSSANDPTAQGERAFIRSLEQILDDRFYLLARVKQKPKEDVDIILIGPNGIWVFGVKHWSGEIYWDDRGWRREQTNNEQGSVEVRKQPKVTDPPDEQWIRAAAEVSRTLDMSAPEVLDRYPALEKVRGGIVFTQEDAVFKFQPGRPAFWGPLNFWIKTLNEIETKVDLDRYSVLQLIEALLNRHQDLAPVDESRSMLTYAQGVVQAAEERLEAWVQA